MSSNTKPESNPAWTAPARQFVPLHLQPGSTRSSFARPDSYNLHRSKSLASASGAPAAVSSPTPTSSGSSAPSQNRTLRSGFASKPKSRLRRPNNFETEDELPPTLSIRVLENQDYDSSEYMGSANGSVLANSGLASSPGSTLAGSGSVASNKNAFKGIPVIVFGFPPGATQSVLQHFSKFGEVTENVASSDSQGSVSAPAIECGRNWLRITFRDRDAAQRALAQNGHLMPGQYVIGCVPAEPGEYTSSMQQSSTNSLLLDDSEVSLIQDHSMASVLDSGDHTEEQQPRESATRAQDTSSQLEQQPQQATHSTHSQQPILTDKIVPKEMPPQMFRDPNSAAAPAVAKPKLHMSEINSTNLPATQAPTSLIGKISSAMTHAFLSWDV